MKDTSPLVPIDPMYLRNEKLLIRNMVKSEIENQGENLCTYITLVLTKPNSNVIQTIKTAIESLNKYELAVIIYSEYKIDGRYVGKKTLETTIEQQLQILETQLPNFQQVQNSNTNKT